MYQAIVGNGRFFKESAGHYQASPRKTLCTLHKVVFYWDQPFLVRWVGWVFSCSIGEKLVSVGLVDQLFQPTSNQVETVEKAFA